MSAKETWEGYDLFLDQIQVDEVVSKTTVISIQTSSEIKSYIIFCDDVAKIRDINFKDEVVFEQYLIDNNIFHKSIDNLLL
jgi:hypothetical protein